MNKEKMHILYSPFPVVFTHLLYMYCVMGYCEHGNEHLGCMKGEEFLEFSSLLQIFCHYFSMPYVIIQTHHL
jgi:hypothetical protein